MGKHGKQGKQGKQKKILDENERLKLENERLKLLVEKLRNESPPEIPESESPKKRSQNIAGWTVSKNPDGYYRARKWIDGKTRSAYVGKRITKAIKPRLQNKEKQILLEAGSPPRPTNAPPRDS
jgi:hypothetical protein